MFTTLAHYAAKPFLKYNQFLGKHPLVTKSVTSGLMYAGGDIIAQALERYNADMEELKDQNVDHLSAFYKACKNVSVDWSRSSVFFVFGCVISGPAYHYWFNSLNELPTLLWQLKQSNQRTRILRAYAYLRSQGIEVKLNLNSLPQAKQLGKWQSKGSKILADQLIFATIYTLVFFVGIGTMRGGVEKFKLHREINSLERSIIDEFDLTRENLENLKFRYKFHSQEDSQWEFRVQPNESSLVRDTTLAQAPFKMRMPTMHEFDESQVDASPMITERYVEGVDVSSKIEDAIGNLMVLESGKVTWTQIWKKSVSHMKEVYLSTLLVDCLVWPPLQLINFTFVPLRYQFLYVNAANLAWNAFLSLMANHKH
jgi:hypothetical protein